jgi:antitoxin component YwqK of YwqJK toxin-antitoxin module
LRESGSWINGDRNGFWVYLDPDRFKIKEENFDKGKPDGAWKTYYANGRASGAGQYVNKVKEGTWQYFDESGKLIMKTEFLNGKKIKEKRYGQAGKELEPGR